MPECIALIGEDYALLLASISELFGEHREKRTLNILEKGAPNHNRVSLHRFYLGSRLFSSLSKLFLKEYIASKNIMMQLGQVYLEYLQCLDKHSLIKYKRDGWHRFDEQLKNSLKMVNMFLDKCVKGAEEALPKQ